MVEKNQHHRRARGKKIRYFLLILIFRRRGKKSEAFLNIITEHNLYRTRTSSNTWGFNFENDEPLSVIGN